MPVKRWDASSLESSGTAMYWPYDEIEPHIERVLARRTWTTDGRYTGMLLRDFSSLVPESPRTRNLITAQTKGIDEDVLAAAISHGETSEPLGDVLCDFINGMMENIVVAGRSIVEIDYLSTRPRPETPVSFRLVPTLPGTVRIGRFTARQVCARSHADKHLLLGKTGRRLQRHHLFAFSLRREEERAMRRLMRFLATADKLESKALDYRVGGLQANRRVYDANERERIFHNLLARESRDTGWDVQELLDGRRLDPSWIVWRSLKFASFRARCLEQILTQFQRLLDDIGQKLDFTARITTPGIASAQRIEEARDEFERGTRSIQELLDFARLEIPI